MYNQSYTKVFETTKPTQLLIREPKLAEKIDTLLKHAQTIRKKSSKLLFLPELQNTFTLDSVVLTTASCFARLFTATAKC